MAHARQRPPSRGDLILSRAVTGLAVAFAVAILVLNLIADDATALGIAASAVTGLGALIWGGGLIVMKVRGDFILGLFGYWWPFMLPQSDEMARAIRQEAFGFSYLSMLCVMLVLVTPMAMVAAVSDAFARMLSDFLPPVTAADMLGFALAALILLAALPQAYLAWTLTPLDDEGEDRSERAA